MAKRLFLIDGYSNIFRAFYAIRGLSNSKGEPTNAVYGFIQMLRKMLRDEKPDLVGVALDVSRKTVRSEKFPEYKANRSPMPEDLRSQVPLIRRALAAYRIPILELESYEADDVLGTLAAKAAAEGYEVVLVSADKDLMQLVGAQVSLYHTGRDKLYDPALVEEDFGVPPEKVTDVLALMGDASDNVPGVPKIGAKGAKTLVKEYGSLPELLDRAEEVSRKSYRESLQENRELAELSLDLVTIHRDLDIAFDPADLASEEPDTDALRELFAELELKTLLEELGGGASAESEPLPPAEEVETPEALAEKAGALGRSVAVAVLGGDEPAGLAFADEEAVFFADFRRDGLRAAAIEALDAIGLDSDRELVGHDLKEVLRLSPEGRHAKANLVDLMLASFLLRSAHSHDLSDLMVERLGLSPIDSKEAGWGKGTAPPLGSEALASYAGQQAGACQRLASRFTEELEDGALDAVYRDIEEPLVPVLLDMEENGVTLDSPFLEAMSEELAKELTALEAEIYELAGEHFNINSPGQLGVILFEKLGYPVLKKTRKTKSYSTTADVLEELASRGYPLPEAVLRFREMAKLKSTYVDALPALVAEDGRVHTRYNQAGAATGRLSSNHPNLQNIPVRTELGRRIRRAFVAPEGHVLLVADYSQIELRVLAHIADEEALIQSFLEGADIHRSTAATVFEVAEDLVSGEQRRAAKTINFGIIYGISGFGLAKNLGVHPQGGRALHPGLPRPLPGSGHLHGRDRRPRQGRGQGRDPLRPCPLATGHPLEELQPARERSSHGDQRPHPGHRGGPHEARDDPRRRQARVRSPRRSPPPHRPRRARPRSPRGPGRSRGRDRPDRDVRRGRAQGSLGGRPRLGAELVRREGVGASMQQASLVPLSRLFSSHVLSGTPENRETIAGIAAAKREPRGRSGRAPTGRWLSAPTST